jgi:hypothetical protein
MKLNKKEKESLEASKYETMFMELLKLDAQLKVLAASRMRLLRDIDNHNDENRSGYDYDLEDYWDRMKVDNHTFFENLVKELYL